MFQARAAPPACPHVRFPVAKVFPHTTRRYWRGPVAKGSHPVAQASKYHAPCVLEEGTQQGCGKAKANHCLALRFGPKFLQTPTHARLRGTAQRATIVEVAQVLDVEVHRGGPWSSCLMPNVVALHSPHHLHWGKYRNKLFPFQGQTTQPALTDG